MEWTFRSDQPIYAQMSRQLSAAIVTGYYSPGQRLPSVRDIAMDAGVNPNTVQRALAELERDGLVFSQRTSGRFVTEDPEKIRSEERSSFLTKLQGRFQSRSVDAEEKVEEILQDFKLSEVRGTRSAAYGRPWQKK